MTTTGRRVLVTGADGFIGSHLAERLVREGADVRALCQYNSHGSWGWLDQAPADVRDSMDIRLGDVRDTAQMHDLVEGVEDVFHLAALISIPYSYGAAESYVDVNVHGTLNLLEAARRHGVRRFIQTSTSEVYGTPEQTPIREDHPLNAQSPYAATKVAADQLANAYHCSFEVPVTILRPFNTYGPRQSTRAVLPTILTQLLSGRTEVQLGRLDPRRDLTFVSDTVEGFVAAAEAEQAVGRTVQLGTGHTVSIGEIFNAACRVLDVEAQAVLDERRLRPDASEVMVLLSDPTLAAELLGWKPTIDLDDGLRSTAEWLREHLDQFNVDVLHR